MVTLSRSQDAAAGWLADPSTGEPYRVGGNVDASGNTVVQTVALPTGTDRSGVTVAGAKNVAALNTARRGLNFQNTSDTEMRVTETGTAATATTGYQVLPAGTFRASSNRAISVFCAVASKTYAASEW